MENNEGKKVIKISLKSFIAIAAATVVVLFVGINIYANSLGKPNIISSIKALIEHEPEINIKLNNYVESEIGVSFYYPEEWTGLDNNHGSGAVGVWLAPESNEKHVENVHFWISMVSEDNNLSPREYAQKNEISNNKIKEGTISVENNEGYYIENKKYITENSSTYECLETVIYVKANSMMYKIQFSGDKELYNQYYGIFEKMLETVKFSEPKYIEETANNNSGDIELTSAYEKYKNLKWLFKDEKKTEFEFGGDKITIENGKVYIQNAQEHKIQVDIIEGTAKYLTGYGTQTLEKIYVITKEGDIWESEYNQKGMDAAFKKLYFNGKVIDMTNGDYTNREVEPPYFLLSTGELINKEGSKYEELEGDFVKSFGWNGCLFYVSSDNTISYYDYKSREYVKIKDLNGNDLKMKDAFIQWSSAYNNIVEENGGIERVFIVKQNGELVYFDGYEKFEVKRYEQAKGKIVKEISEEKEEVEYGGQIKNTRVKFTDGTELLIKDANENYFE